MLHTTVHSRVKMYLHCTRLNPQRDTYTFDGTHHVHTTTLLPKHTRDTHHVYTSTQLPKPSQSSRPSTGTQCRGVCQASIKSGTHMLRYCIDKYTHTNYIPSMPKDIHRLYSHLSCHVGGKNSRIAISLEHAVAQNNGPK